ncbi:MAG: PIN domain-containing protein [Euryarchaeota archaeon]|nr:PIN domain-containing protein [Euryarchaeota archaeon]
MILDTCVLVDILRHDRVAMGRIKSLETDGESLWIPAPALFELWEGTERSDHPAEEVRRLETLVGGYTIAPFGRGHAARAGRLSGALLRRGQMLDPLDAMIAGVALEERQPLLTRNISDFRRVPDLEVVAY